VISLNDRGWYRNHDSPYNHQPRAGWPAEIVQSCPFRKFPPPSESEAGHQPLRCLEPTLTGTQIRNQRLVASPGKTTHA